MYDNPTHYHICNKELGEDRVRVHCHLSGKIKCAAHDNCNLKYQVPKFVPVVFHNLSLLKSWETVKEIFIVFQIMKKTTYLSQSRSSLTNLLNDEGNEGMVKQELRFIGSLRFMSSSLDKLSSKLRKDKFINLEKYYSGNQQSLLLRTDVYPYDYVDSKKIKKQAFLSKKLFILHCTLKTFQMKAINMLKQFGKNLTSEQ